MLIVAHVNHIVAENAEFLSVVIEVKARGIRHIHRQIQLLFMAGQREFSDKLEILIYGLFFDELKVHIDAVVTVEIRIRNQGLNQLFAHRSLFQELTRCDRLVEVIEEGKYLEPLLMRLFDIGAIRKVLVISLIAAEGKPGRHNDIHPARILCERPESLIGRLVGDQVKAEEHLFTEGKARILLFCEVACVGYGFGRAQIFKLHIAGKTVLGLHTGPTCRIGCRTFVIRRASFFFTSVTMLPRTLALLLSANLCFAARTSSLPGDGAMKMRFTLPSR